MQPVKDGATASSPTHSTEAWAAMAVKRSSSTLKQYLTEKIKKGGNEKMKRKIDGIDYGLKKEF
jgi:hypothetical protein